MRKSIVKARRFICDDSMSQVLNMNSHRNSSLNQDDIDTHFELIKIIKRYEFCVGWTLLIAPDHLPKKEVLQACSVNLDKVLIVRKKHCTDVKDVARRALKHENCSALVIWDEFISGTEVASLRQQAQTVGTALYLLDNCNSSDQQRWH